MMADGNDVIKDVISAEEWYPVYEFTAEGSKQWEEVLDEMYTIVEVPREKYEWIQRVLKEFSEMQKYLEERAEEDEHSPTSSLEETWNGSV